MMESDSLAQSPFAIPLEDVNALCAQEGFRLLRNYLAKDADFCAFHSSCDQDAKETWLLHRDILHALTMPIIELFKRASALATAALRTHTTADLELAFAGEARSAYLWLHCFVAEEDEWCRTQGCPACVTTTTLSTESHIRFIIAASLLTTASIASPNSSPTASTTSSPATSPVVEKQQPAPPAGLSLPPLPYILPALRTALSSDPFWGPDYWPYLLSRASQLSASIQALIISCIDLESSVNPPATTPSDNPATKRSATTPAEQFVGSEADGEKGVRLRKSKLAKRQLRMKGEEVELLRRCALQCWARAAVPSHIRGELLGSGCGEKRTRSLTCP